MNFGLQTFTIRKAQKKSIRTAYMPLIELGIKSFEVARIDFNRQNAKELKALKDEYGIEITSIQVKPKYVFGARDKIIEFCRLTECKNVVISMLPFKCILGSEKNFYDFLSSLDDTYNLYKENGITLAYHHHNWEYIKLSNGKTRRAELLSATKEIKLVHDTYWSARSGISPHKQIEEFKNRLLGIHLRDLTFKKRGIQVLSQDAAIGDGVINFEDVLLSAKRAGCQYYVIEQNTKNPYSDIIKSLKNLKAINSRLENKE